MMFSMQTTFIGIDPTAGKHPFVYAALDHERQLLALGEGVMDDVLAFVAGQRQAIIAVCAPRQPNQGLMEDENQRARLNPSPKPGRWENFRVAEYLISQHRIHIPQTSALEEDCPGWMQMGFQLYRRLEMLGYHNFYRQADERVYIEVYPHAAFTVLIDQSPHHKHSLEGRLQRQLILYEQGINVPDPMRFFEEITRHRLLQGILPMDHLYSPGELDALVAAYTAWLAIAHPDQITLLGDQNEGQIILPVQKLRSHY